MKKTRFAASLGYLLVLCGPLLAIGTAAAQGVPATGAAPADNGAAAGSAAATDASTTANSDSGAAASSGGGGELQEVVVTAERRAQNEQTVPMVIGTITGPALTAYGPVDTQKLSTSISGLQIGTSADGPIVYLRGIGYNSTQLGTDSPVGIYVDGVYQSFDQADVFQLNNIQRIEVLYGPQGTLFGRNTTGGVIQIVTGDPSTTARTDASVGYGNYDDSTINFYSTRGLGHGFAGDIAVTTDDQRRGFGSDVSLDTPLLLHWDWSGRSKLLWTDDAGSTIVMTGGFYDWNNDLGLNMILPGTRQLGYGSPGFYNSAQATNGTEDTQPDDAGKKADGTIHFTQDFKSFSIVNILADQNAHTSNVIPSSIPAPTSSQIQHIRDNVWSEELQFLSAAGSPVNWEGGVFLYDDSGWTDLLNFGTTYAANGGGVRTLSNLDTHSDAAYGQAIIPFGHTTRLTLGARYTRDYRDVWGGKFQFVGPVIPTSQNHTWSKFTERVALDHDFASNVLGYVTFNTGFKSGGYSLTNPTAPVVQPENVIAYETGVKTELFDQHLQFNTALFYYDYTNLQLRGVQPNTMVQLLLNASNARVYGTDISVVAAPTEAFHFNASFEYLHARYVDFPNAQIIIPGPEGAYVQGVYVGGTSGVGSVSGNQMVNAPEFSVVTGVTYTVNVNPGNLVYSLNAKWTDQFPWTVDDLVWNAPLWLVNASIQYNFDSEKFYIQAYSNNLLNKEWFMQEGEGTTSIGYTPGYPRLYGIRVGAHF